MNERRSACLLFALRLAVASQLLQVAEHRRGGGSGRGYVGRQRLLAPAAPSIIMLAVAARRLVIMMMAQPGLTA